MATGLLISRLPVRLHELERLCHYIGTRHDVSFAELDANFSPHRESILTQRSTLLKELLGFLISLDLVQSSGERRWEDRSFQAPNRGQSFRLALIARLREVADKRQRAFLGVHDELVAHELVYTTTQEVMALMERSRYAECFAWNETKITFWSRFMADLGLLVYVPPLRLAISPSSATLLRVIPPGDHPLRSLLETIHRNYFAVFTRLGEPHAGLAHALLRLAKSGSIELHYESDASHSLVLQGQRLSRLTRIA